MHDLTILLFEVILFAVIFLLVGFFLVVSLFATKLITAPIILMVTMVLGFITIPSVALMVVVLVATMMPVIQVMLMSNRNMSHFLFLWLLLLLELVKDIGCFIGRLTLLEKGHKPKMVHGHCFVCFCKLKLMCLGLHEKDLFAFLLRCGKLHCLTEVAAVVIAEELHLMPHKLMHWHEGGLLDNAKPTN